jgi:hypothetical protein
MARKSWVLASPRTFGPSTPSTFTAIPRTSPASSFCTAEAPFE